MNRFATIALAGLLVVFTAGGVDAQTVSAHVEGNNSGTFTSNPQGPSAAEVSSYLEFPGAAIVGFGRDAFGLATQRPTGVGGVVADAVWASGGTGNYVESRTLWTHSATNTGSTVTEFVFTFLVHPSQLRIADYAGLEETDPQRPDISFSLTIRANSVVIWNADAELIGGSVSHVLNESGTSLSPTPVGGGSIFGYDFASYGDMLSLGFFNPGETVTVEYEMIARVDSPGYECGGRAAVGDPFDLDGTPGFEGTITPGGPIPVRETSWGKIKELYR